MLRQGKWKTVRQNLIEEPDSPIELYDLEKDIAEEYDLAAQYPEIASQLWNLMNNARTKSIQFPFPALDNQIIPRTLNSEFK